MKCPNCDFIDKDEAFGEPATCPKCGAIYEKALRIRESKERQELFEKQRRESQPSRQGVTLKDRLANASSSVSDGREKREKESLQARQGRESRSVIIEDIDMPFWSMVSFMVKWAIASIPALLILILIFVGFTSLFGVIFR